MLPRSASFLTVYLGLQYTIDFKTPTSSDRTPTRTPRPTASPRPRGRPRRKVPRPSIWEEGPSAQGGPMAHQDGQRHLGSPRPRGWTPGPLRFGGRRKAETRRDQVRWMGWRCLDGSTACSCLAFSSVVLGSLLVLRCNAWLLGSFSPHLALQLPLHPSTQLTPMSRLLRVTPSVTSPGILAAHGRQPSNSQRNTHF